MIVLDTNVLSEAMRPSPDPAVARWMVRERGRGLFTTAVSEGEIIYGIAILPGGRRRRDLEAAAQRILALFAGRILPFDSLAAREFAAIVADRRRLGRPIEGFDAQIAAITRAHGMSLATRNSQDFAEAGVPIIDPWQH
jgi:predicted nucleic acid-binding protein